MNKQNKLIKLIEIATGNGWEEGMRMLQLIHKLKVVDVDFIFRVRASFNHDFAKAIWGEAPDDGWDGSTPEKDRGYKYHLQQAVISEDPLEYYWKNK